MGTDVRGCELHIGNRGLGPPVRPPSDKPQWCVFPQIDWLRDWLAHIGTSGPVPKCDLRPWRPLLPSLKACAPTVPLNSRCSFVRGYIFHALHFFLLSCPCGRPRPGARARAGACRPLTMAMPYLRQSQVTHGSPKASPPPTLRPHTYVRLRHRSLAANSPPGAIVTPLPPPRPWWLGFLPAASPSQQRAREQGRRRCRRGCRLQASCVFTPPPL